MKKREAFPAFGKNRLFFFLGRAKSVGMLLTKNAFDVMIKYGLVLLICSVGKHWLRMIKVR